MGIGDPGHTTAHAAARHPEAPEEPATAAAPHSEAPQEPARTARPRPPEPEPARVEAGSRPSSSPTPPIPPHRHPPLLAPLIARARAEDVQVPSPLIERVALDLPADTQVQVVGLLTGLENRRPVLLVLTEWHVAIGPLAEGLLTPWPQREWRRASLLVVPRAVLAEAQVEAREISLVLARRVTEEAGRSTQFVRLPLAAVSANVRPTLDWVVAQSPARKGGADPPPGTPAWAPDPTGQARMRWWDGSAWTGHTRY